MAIDGKKVIEYMRAKNYRILALNIVYLEDVNADSWEPVKGQLDQWDDARCIIRNNGEVLLSCEATTEPGKYYTSNPLNDNGAFRIAFGNYEDCWQIGDHKGQLALVQCDEVVGHRDLNKDGFRTNDKTFKGMFGINQHTTSKTSGAAPDLVGLHSAGCCVGRYSTTHYNDFMRICKAMGRVRFDTTIIAGDEFAAWKAV